MGNTHTLRPGTLGRLLGISSALMGRETPANSTHGPDNRCERNDNAAAGTDPECSQVVTAGKTADRSIDPPPETAQTVNTTEPVKADVKALGGGRPAPVHLSGDAEASMWLLGVVRDEANSIKRRMKDEEDRLGYVPAYLRDQLGNAMHWIGELEDAGAPE